MAAGGAAHGLAPGQVLKVLRSTLPAGAPSSAIGPETAERLLAAAQAQAPQPTPFCHR